MLKAWTAFKETLFDFLRLAGQIVLGGLGLVILIGLGVGGVFVLFGLATSQDEVVSQGGWFVLTGAAAVLLARGVLHFTTRSERSRSGGEDPDGT